jgi:hypothetical protein
MQEYFVEGIKFNTNNNSNYFGSPGSPASMVVLAMSRSNTSLQILWSVTLPQPDVTDDPIAGERVISVNELNQCII